MNERIFELIQSQNGFSGLVWTEEDKQEFAQLIVQEVCWDMMNSHVDKTKINRVAKSWGVDVGVKE